MSGCLSPSGPSLTKYSVDSILPSHSVSRFNQSLTHSGGKFTIRLVHSITPLLYEALLLSLIGDQFDEGEAVVGCVLSVRQGEDILSVWVEEEGESVRSGALR